jgi:hypothetical protein
MKVAIAWGALAAWLQTVFLAGRPNAYTGGSGQAETI